MNTSSPRFSGQFRVNLEDSPGKCRLPFAQYADYLYNPENIPTENALTSVIRRTIENYPGLQIKLRYEPAITEVIVSQDGIKTNMQGATITPVVLETKGDTLNLDEVDAELLTKMQGSGYKVDYTA